MNNTELEDNTCSICLENIETNIIECKRCNNKNCIDCYSKIEKRIKIDQEDIIILFKCPLCCIDIEIKILEKDNIEIYNSKKIVINYLTELLKVNTTNIIHIKNLVDKVAFLEYYVRNIKNIMKTFFIFDKIITISGILVVVVLIN